MARRSNMSEQYKKLSEWSLSLLNSAARSGVVAAAKALKTNTKIYLVASHPNATRPNKNWPFTIDQGVLIGKRNKKQVLSSVHLMGHRALPGTHRLRWIANGTVERYHKSGKYVGKIEPTAFFETAIRHTPIDQIINAACNKAIQRINRTHYSV